MAGLSPAPEVWSREESPSRQGFSQIDLCHRVTKASRHGLGAVKWARPHSSGQGSPGPPPALVGGTLTLKLRLLPPSRIV